MPVDRFEQRKLTRSKLIDAALQLFSSSGYDHATVDDISQAAGYSKGAYYFHFSTKDDILLELLRLWTEGRAVALTAGDGVGSALESLRANLASFVSYDDQPQWRGVLLEFWAQAARNPEVSKRLTQAYSTWRRQLTESYEAAAAEGLNIESPAEAASIALAAHDGYVVQLVIGTPGGTAMQPEEIVDALLAPAEVSEQITRRAAAI